jgi:hypothetical protein
MQPTELVTLNMRELDRLKVIQAVVDRMLKPGLAAERLHLTVRQVERLVLRYKQAGAAGVGSRARGRPGNRKLDDGTAYRALILIRDRYADFGPTFACEKLRECHGLTLSKETVRHLMIDAGLWIPRKQRPPKIHQPRNRRSCLGELIQIDGSDHRWFEERAPACTLLVFIDDATSRLMTLHFTATESTFSYFEATRHYLEAHGMTSPRNSAFAAPLLAHFGVVRARFDGTNSRCVVSRTTALVLASRPAMFQFATKPTGTVLSGIEVPRRKVRQPPRRGGTPPHAVRSPLRRGIRQLGDAPPEREILIRHWHEGDEHVIGRDPGGLLQQTGYRGQQGFLVRCRTMLADQNRDDHGIRRSVHLHERGIDEQFIIAVFTDHYKTVSLGNVQCFDERLIQCIADGNLLFLHKAAFRDVGMKYRHGLFSG